MWCTNDLIYQAETEVRGMGKEIKWLIPGDMGRRGELRVWVNTHTHYLTCAVTRKNPLYSTGALLSILEHPA